MDVVIVGTGGLAKELWGMLTDMNVTVLGFVAEKNTSGYYCGLPILGNDAWLMEQKGMNVVVGIGKPRLRRTIFEKLRQAPLNFHSFIHPKAIVFGKLNMRGGCTIMPGGVIEPDVTIGFGTHINMGVTVGHDVVIGDYCVVNHNAGISGNARIGNCVLVGAGATIKEEHTVGEHAIVGLGAILTKDVPDGETWISTAAKPMVKPITTLAEVYGIDQ